MRFEEAIKEAKKEVGHTSKDYEELRKDLYIARECRKSAFIQVGIAKDEVRNLKELLKEVAEILDYCNKNFPLDKSKRVEDYIQYIAKLTK